MKWELARIMLLFTIVLLVGCVGIHVYFRGKADLAGAGENNLVLLNEIEKLTSDEEGDSPAKAQIEKLRVQLGNGANNGYIRENQEIIAYFCLFTLYTAALLFYLYRKILKPFSELEQYAGQIAKGNLNVELNYQRTNFFGAFTWAFDHMRQKIIRTREREQAAVTENKTIIAALSHDIKTPIASIRAYAEGLEAGLEADYEQRQRYLSVIMKKCDEVTRLTNDLVLHSLSELESLEIHLKRQELGALYEEIVRDLEDKNVSAKLPFVRGEAAVDERRLAQVVENLLGNARKYAPGTRIDVWTERNDFRYEFHVRDHGSGISPEDMPFVFDKFYRGRNVSEQPGSGLGLYIVKYITNQMDGDVELISRSDGLEAVVWIPFS